MKHHKALATALVVLGPISCDFLSSEPETGEYEATLPPHYALPSHSSHSSHLGSGLSRDVIRTLNRIREELAAVEWRIAARSDETLEELKARIGEVESRTFILLDSVEVAGEDGSRPLANEIAQLLAELEGELTRARIQAANSSKELTAVAIAELEGLKATLGIAGRTPAITPDQCHVSRTTAEFSDRIRNLETEFKTVESGVSRSFEEAREALSRSIGDLTTEIRIEWYGARWKHDRLDLTQKGGIQC